MTETEVKSCLLKQFKEINGGKLLFVLDEKYDRDLAYNLSETWTPDDRDRWAFRALNSYLESRLYYPDTNRQRKCLENAERQLRIYYLI